MVINIYLVFFTFIFDKILSIVISLYFLVPVMDRSEDQPHADKWSDLHRLKTQRPKEHSSLLASTTQECAGLHARMTLHVSCSVPNQTPHNLETVMTSAHLYKGELASPSRYTSLFTTLLTHSFSILLLT